MSPCGRTVCVALVAAIAAPACKSPEVTDDMRREFGRFAVVASPEPWRAEVGHPVAGWGAGLGMGLTRGVSAVVVWPVVVLGSAPPGGGDGAGIVAAAMMAIGAAAAVAWTPFSTIGGAVTAVPVDAADAAEQVLTAIARDPANAQRIADVVLEGARSRGWPDPVGPAEADTVITVRLESIERGRSWNWWTFDREFPFGCEAAVTIVRVSDGAVVWTGTRTAGFLEFEPSVVEGSMTSAVKQSARQRGLVSTHLRYLDWAADGGAPLRRQLDAEFRFLGLVFAAEIFGTPAVAKPSKAPAPSGE